MNPILQDVLGVNAGKDAAAARATNQTGPAASGGFRQGSHIGAMTRNDHVEVFLATQTAIAQFGQGMTMPADTEQGPMVKKYFVSRAANDALRAVGLRSLLPDQARGTGTVVPVVEVPAPALLVEALLLLGQYEAIGCPKREASHGRIMALLGSLNTNALRGLNAMVTHLTTGRAPTTVRIVETGAPAQAGTYNTLEAALTAAQAGDFVFIAPSAPGAVHVGTIRAPVSIVAPHWALRNPDPKGHTKVQLATAIPGDEGAVGLFGLSVSAGPGQTLSAHSWVLLECRIESPSDPCAATIFHAGATGGIDAHFCASIGQPGGVVRFHAPAVSVCRSTICGTLVLHGVASGEVVLCEILGCVTQLLSPTEGGMRYVGNLVPQEQLRRPTYGFWLALDEQSAINAPAVSDHTGDDNRAVELGQSQSEAALYPFLVNCRDHSALWVNGQVANKQHQVNAQFLTPSFTGDLPAFPRPHAVIATKPGVAVGRGTSLTFDAGGILYGVSFPREAVRPLFRSVGTGVIVANLAPPLLAGVPFNNFFIGSRPAIVQSGYRSLAAALAFNAASSDRCSLEDARTFREAVSEEATAIIELGLRARDCPPRQFFPGTAPVHY